MRRAAGIAILAITFSSPLLVLYFACVHTNGWAEASLIFGIGLFTVLAMFAMWLIEEEWP